VLRRTLCLLCALTVVSACGGKKKSAPKPDAPGGAAVAKKKPRPGERMVESRGAGLKFRLSDGQGAGEPGERLPPAQGTPLDAAATAAIEKRLPKLPAAEQKSFALRPASQPPPKAGDVVKTPFPPPDQVKPPPAPDPDAGKPGVLEVVRHQPEGDVSLAPHISVTFSQPMVAVTSHADTVAKGVPVTISPMPKGKWRWVGAKTLLFEPDDNRFPAATEYTVEVPAGTTSATGVKLASAVSWRFRTPPPQVVSYWPPSGVQRRDPVLFVQFDQDVSPEAVLPTITLDADKVRPIRLATKAEIEKDETVKELVENAPDGRWLAFTPKEKLPGDYRIDVKVGPGTPSLEGPRKTTEPYSWSFRTYGPMVYEGKQCGWGGPCRPDMAWEIDFSNPIDPETFDSSMIKVEPEVKGLKVDVWGDRLGVYGRFKGRTTYKVTLGKKIPDRFGQTLVEQKTITFEVAPAEKQLFAGDGGALLTLDPGGKPAVSVYSVNLESVKLNVWKVEPGDLDAYLRYVQEYYRRDRAPKMPGRLVAQKTIKVKGEPDEMAETRIPLDEWLDGGAGNLVVQVLDPNEKAERWDRFHIEHWVMATQTGLTAIVDHEQIVVWATRLADGAPLADVEVRFFPDEPGIGPATTDKDGVARLPLPAAPPKGYQRMLVARAKGSADVAFLTERPDGYTYHYYNYDEGGRDRSVDSQWMLRPRADRLLWHVFDDRTMYRPKEEVHVKGWVRKLAAGRDATPALPPTKEILWRAKDSSGRELAKGSAPVNAMGGFDLAFKLPDTPNLGHATVELGAVDWVVADGGTRVHGFRIEEFRRPEFEVAATVPEGPFVIGGFAEVDLKAVYYAGGGLSGADVQWTVTQSPGSFYPPGRDGYSFGRFVPWWGWRSSGWDDEGDGEGGGGRRGPQPASFPARTNPLGGHALRIDFDGIDDPQPTSVIAQAAVTDVNRQQWAARATMLVHPADHYVGLRSDRPFFDKGQRMDIEAIVVDLDGKHIPGAKIAMKAVRLDWEWKKGRYKQIEVDPETCDVVTGPQDAPVTCTFHPKEGGTFKVTAEITDGKGRKNKTELTRWVAGGKQPPSRSVDQQEVTIIPDKKEYQPGQTAKLMVMAPFAGGEGLVTWQRRGIEKTQRFRMDGTTHTLEIPIRDADMPSLTLRVDVVGKADRAGDDGGPDPRLPKRPAYAVGSATLAVPPLARKLGVTVTPRESELEPGGETTVDVVVTDAAGAPAANAEVALVVVDESIWALSGRSVVDPLGSFVHADPGYVRAHQSRAEVVLANLLDLVKPQGAGNGEAEEAGGTGSRMALDEGKMGKKESGRGGGQYAIGNIASPGSPAAASPAPAPPAEAPKSEEKSKDKGRAEPDGDSGQSEPGPEFEVRKNFDPLATWAPAVTTDGRGRATVKVKLPDNLTRYRVMAVAVHGDTRFGAGESAVTARLPLMVRPNAPRFLNFGDRFELSVVLQNQTDLPMPVEMVVRASNAELGADRARKVMVPANDRVEVRFAANALMAGTARFQIGVIGAGKWPDAAEVELPVWTPATTEAFATYGELDGNAVTQPVAPPGDVWKEFGGLEISTSSTAVAQLTDAVIFLVSYRFECSEQISSRMLAVAGLRDVLAAFKAEGLPPAPAIEAAMGKDIDRLRGRQTGSGGFLLWDDSREVYPWASINVTHALVRAEQKGYAVPPDMLAAGLEYLRTIENHLPGWWPAWVRRAHIAYALYVRKHAGTGDAGRARELLAEAPMEQFGMDDLGFILFALADEKGAEGDVQKILRYLGNRVTETAGAAKFVTSYEEEHGYLVMASNRRADGILLEAMIAAAPKSDLIPKLVRGLMNDRKRGHWGNTQENAFVLLGMDRYFRTYEKVTPNFVARAWLGDQFAGEHAFRGRTTETHQVDVPMAQVTATNLVIGKDGPGRLYYRVGMRYAPRDLMLPPAEHGFTVERQYEAVDDPGDVKRDADGTWRIKAGARVRVRVTMVAPAYRSFVALVDPLPAGLEVMNTALAVTADVPDDPKQAEQRYGRYWWWWGPWYDHQNVRDERVEAFATRLWEGVWTYTYVARATNYGTFVVPPAKAEEMYEPETFGRSATDKVVVE
jgi:hypothetical protein